MSFRKHLVLATRAAKIEAMDRMEDYVAFIFISIGTLLRIAITVIFFQAIYGHVNTIGGWAVEEVYVLLGTWFFIDGISWMSYQRGFNRLSRFIERGDLDVLISKPINLKVFLSYRFADVVFTNPYLVVAVGMIVYGASLTSSPINIPLYLLFMVFAFIIHHSFMLMLGCVNFFYIIEAPTYMRQEIMKLGQYPVSIYKGVVKLILSFLIPLAFMFTFPARAFFGNVTLFETIQVFIVAVIFYLLSNAIWKYSLNHYESAQG